MGEKLDDEINWVEKFKEIQERRRYLCLDELMWNNSIESLDVWREIYEDSKKI